jgi:hypothetical protein
MTMAEDRSLFPLLYKATWKGLDCDYYHTFSPNHKLPRIPPSASYFRPIPFVRASGWSRWRGFEIPSSARVVKDNYLPPDLHRMIPRVPSIFVMTLNGASIFYQSFYGFSFYSFRLSRERPVHLISGSGLSQDVFETLSMGNRRQTISSKAT